MNIFIYFIKCVTRNIIIEIKMNVNKFNISQDLSLYLQNIIVK